MLFTTSSGPDSNLVQSGVFDPPGPDQSNPKVVSKRAKPSYRFQSCPCSHDGCRGNIEPSFHHTVVKVVCPRVTLCHLSITLSLDVIPDQTDKLVSFLYRQTCIRPSAVGDSIPDICRETENAVEKDEFFWCLRMTDQTLEWVRISLLCSETVSYRCKMNEPRHDIQALVRLLISAIWQGLISGSALVSVVLMLRLDVLFRR